MFASKGDRMIILILIQACKNMYNIYRYEKKNIAKHMI